MRWLGVTLLLCAPPSHAMDHGSPVGAGKWPEVVALVDHGTRGAGIFGSGLKGVFCTGTLIRPRIIVTAAHCVTERSSEAPRADLPSQVSIYRGEGRLNYLGPVQGQARIVRALVHPRSGDGIDLAVLALDQPLAGVEPASLGTTAIAKALEIVSVGFGEAHPGEERNTMGRKSAARRRIDLLDDKEVCSLRAGIKTPSSAGDSGGPAFAPDGKLVGALTGMRTKNQKELDCWIPLAAHLAWLNQAIATLEAAAK